MTTEYRNPLEVLSLYPLHDETINGVLASRLAAGPDRPFILCQGRSLSWQEVAAETARTAQMLMHRGVQQGDRVAIMAPNSDAFVILFFALARIGAIMVPVNPDFNTEEAGYILTHAGVKAIACTPDTLPVAAAATPELPVQPWCMLLEGSHAQAPTVQQLISQTPDDIALPGDISADDTCLILYTSGTTGFPKGVMHSQRSYVIAGEGFVERMHLQPEDRLLCVLPMFHINALFYSLSGTMAAGATIIIAPRFSASRFWQLAAETGATEVNIIAAVGNILARRPREEFVPSHRIRKVYGSPISQDINDIFQRDFHIPVLIEGYGMTEIPGVIQNPFDGPQKIGSMGRAGRHPDHHRPYAQVRIIDDNGHDLAVGEVGEMAIRTPIIMKGYYRSPEQTREAFLDGWFLTGDLARQDEDGYFWFIARKKDIIRRRGENISGAELDRVIGLHPRVAEAAAIAVPSELGEDDILVAIVSRNGEPPAPEEIIAWCRERLAPIKVPRYLAYVDSLPHTPTHRVAKFKVKKDPDIMARAIDMEARKPV